MGIDIGTSGCKSLLVDAKGKVLARATAEYPMRSPRPLWTEQDPEEWWDAAVATIREVLEVSGVQANQVAALGLTGQMHGMVLMDSAGRVLRPCILWNDQRTARECREITERVGPQRVIRLTGNPVLAGFTAPKIAWIRRNEPEVFGRTSRWLLPKDYLRYRLTGSFVTEPSDASGTALFDVRERRWSEEMLEAVEVPPRWLPEVSESGAASARISAQAAGLTGLLQGTPVAGGGGDQAAQAVGMGIVSEGVTSVAMGTSAVLFSASDTCRVEPRGRLHTFCHAVPGKWALLGVVLSGGGSLRWYRDQLGQEECRRARETSRGDYEVITEVASRAPAGCEGLVFLPYLTGNRVPHADPAARGVFFGLTLRHGRDHLARSILEGVAFALNDSLQIMRGLGLETSRLTASGGGARSPLWRQILADVFSAPISTVRVDEGAAFGAALLGGVAAGVYPDAAGAAATVVEETGCSSPGQAVPVYARYYRVFRRLYPALRREFAELSSATENPAGD
jgi:xylulokinase